MVKMTLIQGDCLKVLSTIPDKSVDLIVTDPPYGINYVSNHSKNKNYRKNIADNTQWDFNYDLSIDFPFDMIWNKLKDNSHMYVFCRWDVLHRFKEKPKNIIIWWKKDYAGGMEDLDFWGHSFEIIAVFQKGKRKIKGSRINVIPTNCVKNNFRMLHPTMKDIEIIRKLILTSSDEGETVLDCYLGSGTIMKACLELKRNCIGVEIEPKWIETTKKRMNWGSSLSNSIEWEFKKTM